MSAIGDALKVLDKIPLWKRLQGLPDRVDDVERRIAALEEAATPAMKCPMCGDQLKIVSTEPERRQELYEAGVERHDVECAGADCSYSGIRQYDPRVARRE